MYMSEAGTVIMNIEYCILNYDCYSKLVDICDWIGNYYIKACRL